MKDLGGGGRGFGGVVNDAPLGCWKRGGSPGVEDRQADTMRWKQQSRLRLNEARQRRNAGAWRFSGASAPPPGGARPHQAISLSPAAAKVFTSRLHGSLPFVCAASRCFWVRTSAAAEMWPCPRAPEKPSTDCGGSNSGTTARHWASALEKFQSSYWSLRPC